MATGGINTDIPSNETFDIQCTMCKNQGKNLEADKFCIDCNDYFCLSCVKVHSHVPFLQGHKVLDKGQFPSGSSKGLPEARTERCDIHSHKHIDMYCQNHDDVGCATCMAVYHRLCKDTFYIQEYIQNNAGEISSRDIQRKLEAAAMTLTEHYEKFQEEKQRLLKRKTELLDNIRKLRKEINDRLDELERSSVNEIEEKFKALLGDIEGGMKQLQTNIDGVTSAKDKFASPTASLSEVFVNIKMRERVARNADNCIADNITKVNEQDIDFECDNKITALLEEMKALGKTQQMIPLLQIKGKKTYGTKVQSDSRTCDIHSACYMEDGTIILCDRINSILKRLDSSTYIVTDHCELPGEPWQVCPINKQQVAVTLPWKKEVHFISLGSSMTSTNKICTDFNCVGLAFVNNNLYISDRTSTVYIYTVSGKLKQFSKDQSGQALFSDIYSLAVSKDASKIYVADWNNGLIILDNNGEVVGQFNGPQLQHARCCYFTEAGSVFVSAWDSKNVIQFTSNGELIGEVLNACGEDRGILAVCCNQQMSKMVVGRYYKDNIEVYDI